MIRANERGADMLEVGQCHVDALGPPGDVEVWSARARRSR